MTSTPDKEGDGGIGVPFDAMGRPDAGVRSGAAGRMATSCPAVAGGTDRDAAQGAAQGFPRTARLLHATEFSTLFRMRPLKRSEHFVVYARPRERASVPPERVSRPAAEVTGQAVATTMAEPAPAANAAPGDSAAVLPGRMGLVLGRKSAPRAATRNMVRRALRETFRQRRAEYEGWDLLIRMHARFDKQRFPGAASPALKRACRAEVGALLDEARRHVARRRTALAP
ncbi:MAG: ribonuclease P protein component [Janthinobacterium lividum]